MVVSGLSNLRNFDARFCDSALLTEDDWDDDSVPPEFASVISGNTKIQRVYMIENCKLSVTSTSSFPNSHGGSLGRVGKMRTND